MKDLLICGKKNGVKIFFFLLNCFDVVSMHFSNVQSNVQYDMILNSSSYSFIVLTITFVVHLSLR